LPWPADRTAVEKKFGKVGDKLNAAEFRAKCRKYAAEQIARQRADFKRLGVLGDWERPYLTMDPQVRGRQLRALSRIVRQRPCHAGLKPVHWCLDCGSALAEAEVEYQDKTSFAIDVGFASTDPAELAAVFGLPALPAPIRFVIWTTTPWTIPANKATSTSIRNSTTCWSRPREHGVRLVLAEAPARSVPAKRYGTADPVVLGRAKGARARAARRYLHPFDAEAQPKPSSWSASTSRSMPAPASCIPRRPRRGRLQHRQEVRPAVENPVMGDGRLCRRYAAVRRPDVGRPIRRSSRRCAMPARCFTSPSSAQLPALLAPQDAGDLPRHPQWFMSMDGRPAQGRRRSPPCGRRGDAWFFPAGARHRIAA
jgi:hypothetical protein